MNCGRHLFHRDGSDDRSPLESFRSAPRYPEQSGPIDARHVRDPLRLRRHAAAKLQDREPVMRRLFFRCALPVRIDGADPVKVQACKKAGRLTVKKAQLKL